MWYITNATIERNSFVNRTYCCSSGAVLYSSSSSVLIRQCIVSNNRVRWGAIYGSQSTFVIEQTAFRNNYPYCCNDIYGGAICLVGGNLDILNSNFSDNLAVYHSAAYHTAGGAIF